MSGSHRDGRDARPTPNDPELATQEDLEKIRALGFDVTHVRSNEDVAKLFLFRDAAGNYVDQVISYMIENPVAGQKDVSVQIKDRLIVGLHRDEAVRQGILDWHRDGKGQGVEGTPPFAVVRTHIHHAAKSGCLGLVMVALAGLTGF